MLRPYGLDSNRAKASYFNAQQPYWDLIRQYVNAAANARRFGRVTIFVVVPHSCRFGAG